MRWIVSVAAACCVMACSGEQSDNFASQPDGGSSLDGGSEDELDGGGDGDGDGDGDAAAVSEDAGNGDGGDDASVPSGDFERVAHVYAGDSHACALMVDGRVKCWGGNGNGELGRGDNISLGDDPNELGAMLEVVELGSNDVEELALGTDFSCARFGDGTVKCWGGNDDGQLGQEMSVEENVGDDEGELAALMPVNLGLGRTAVDIDVGAQFACALLDDGSIKCWGANESGQLGQNDDVDRGASAGDMAALAPVDLGSGRTATQMSLGYRHVCVVRDDDALVCWGHNGDGQMGRGTIDVPLNAVGDQTGEMGDFLVPLSLGTGRTVERLDSGNSHTCALLDDGTLKCWGSNFEGTLGLGDENHRGDEADELGDALDVVGFAENRTVAQFTVGEGHACALLDDDSAACWGANGSGELGVGDDLSRGAAPGVIDDAPLVGSGRQVIEFALGEAFTCALLDTERVKCWGDASGGVPGVGASADNELGDEVSELGDALGYIDLGKP